MRGAWERSIGRGPTPRPRCRDQGAPAGVAADPERLHRFEQEARAAAALNHPNILAVYDIGQHDGSPISSPSCSKEKRCASDWTVVRYPSAKPSSTRVQIAHGLAAAHEKGITHRDLKPENVFVTTDGRVKILDFGLAKLTQAEPAVAAVSALPTIPPDTSPGVVLGTIGYMAPEQVRGQQADHRSDIFAFGAILYEMLSGQRAFRGDTAADTMGAILTKDPPDLPTAERHIPPALVRIVDAAWRRILPRGFSPREISHSLSKGCRPARTALLACPCSHGEGHGTRGAGRRAVAVLATAALAVLATLYVRRTVPEPVVTRLDVVTPPTSDAFSFALSPDGRQLAFVANGERFAALAAAARPDGAQPLAGTEGAAYPFWAPDGRAIGFFADGKLKRIDLTGGE